MNESFFKDVSKNSQAENEQFNDEAIQYITDRINAMIDIPLISEKVEGIIIQALMKIIFNLLSTRNGILTQN